jgi:hypothetical protein
MPEIRIKQIVEEDVNIDVYCGTCGAGLCGNTTVDNRRMFFTIEACPDCMAEKDSKIKELEEEIERIKAAACV